MSISFGFIKIYCCFFNHSFLKNNIKMIINIFMVLINTAGDESLQTVPEVQPGASFTETILITLIGVLF